MASPLYSFPVRRLSGARCKLDAYAGTVLLMVNVASPDIFTRPYGDLERLHRTYSDRGFAVLGFPSDDSDHQDTGPSGDTEMCSTSNDTEVCSPANYDVQFPIFDKIVTKGANQHPLNRYLTAMQPVRYPVQTASYLSISSKAAFFRPPQPMVNCCGTSRSSSSRAMAK
jgi:glutathione peroxidase